MAEKETRCWPGYEPVPGKKQHSEGSCRPKPDSKSTSAQKELKAKRRQQLDKWQADHPGSKTSAAQHLHAPGTENKDHPKEKGRKNKPISEPLRKGRVRKP